MELRNDGENLNLHGCRRLRTRCIWANVLIVLATVIPWTAHADGDLDVRRAIAKKMMAAWQTDDFGLLESMENDFLNPVSRTPSGKRTLSVFQADMFKLISIRPESATSELLLGSGREPEEEINGPPLSRYEVVNKQWDGVQKKIEKWQKRFPNSPHPNIAMAQYYLNRGSYFRGQRFSEDVLNDAWPTYRSCYNSAKKLLLETKNISQKNPAWFEIMFVVLGAEQVHRTEIDALISETLVNGQGYPDAFQAAFHYMQPRWGGSYERMEEFAVMANEKTYEQEHGEMYSRLYWNLVATQADELDQGFFARTRASWPLISKSFEAIVRDHPEPRNFSGYALFACIEKDRTKAKELLADAGTMVYFSKWPRELQQLCSPN
jgi:hypothetical protein